MTSFISKFRIPTLLGVGIILIGIIAGVFLVVREQNLQTLASPNLLPQNIQVTNIEDTSVVISWQTSQPSSSFVTFGQNSTSELTVLDDRDTVNPAPHTSHYVTIKNLQPATSYQFKIVSGKISSNINKFTTAAPISNQTGFAPLIGSVLDNNTPLTDGIVYLIIEGAITQSALIKTVGNFLIPLSSIRKSNLSDIFPLNEETVAKLTVLSDKGQASAIFKLKASGVSLPPLKLGQDIDLKSSEDLNPPQPTTQELDKFDLNKDGLINAADHAIVLKNFGKNSREKKADFNGDGVVDQKDLDLISQKINQFITP